MLTRTNRGLVVAGVILAEVVLIAAAYQAANVVECYDTVAVATCRFLRSLAARALAVFAVGLILWRARPAAFARLAGRAAAHPAPRPWAALHGAGLILLVLPLLLAGGADLTARFSLVAPPLAAGALAAAVGGVFWLAPPSAWAALMRAEGRILLPALAVALLIPDLADLAQPLWDLRGLTRATFAAVAQVVAATGAVTYADPGSLILGVGDFAVVIARQCSGVEGFALVAAFVALSAVLFRGSLRVGRFLLVVLPVGLALSWLLNVARIAALILIGAHVSPDLAVNGFHSYAGWLFFVLLALAILAVAQTVPWFHRAGGAEAVAVPPPLARDPVAAMIVPFLAFMLSSVAVSALSADPALGWPLIAAALAAALAAFLPVWRAMDWRPDPAAAGAGVLVGAAWLAFDPGGGRDAGPALAGAAFAAWAVVRVLATVALVPLVEEAFFRGYLLTRLDRGGPAWRVVAVAVSSAAFAALHDRWLMAAAAGVIFALIKLRRGRLPDAVLAHATANAIVAAGAVWSGDWSRL
jgi:exosortase E/protease (VPEID-CTERM system)